MINLWRPSGSDKPEIVINLDEDRRLPASQGIGDVSPVSGGFGPPTEVAIVKSNTVRFEQFTDGKHLQVVPAKKENQTFRRQIHGSTN